jgi:MinD superfamily P-loop ATPase
MKQLAILSGKGGTGKTSLAASFAALMPSKVIADCDVDAADMHLILEPRIERREAFAGGQAAGIDAARCTRCGRCRELCRFEAISEEFSVDPIACEGCGVCEWNCPEKAISLSDDRSGEWYVSATRHGPLVHARLGPAQENSGKLVTLVRGEAKRIARERGLDHVLIDGPPGIACPAMAASTGADAVLIVMEPTLSGLHDFKRLAQLLAQFEQRGWACINKWDINPDLTERMEKEAGGLGIPVLGRIRYDAAVIKAQIKRRAVVEDGTGPAAEDTRALWGRVKNELG